MLVVINAVSIEVSVSPEFRRSLTDPTQIGSNPLFPRAYFYRASLRRPSPQSGMAEKAFQTVQQLVQTQAVFCQCFDQGWVCLRDLLHFFPVHFLFPKKGSDGVPADRSIEKSRKSVCILVLVSSDVVKGQGAATSDCSASASFRICRYSTLL